jgi:prevent-host-death family protein
MPNIKPISVLRNYSEILNNVTSGEPLFLTKNGHGKYAVLEISDYERMQARLKLISDLTVGEAEANELGWQSLEDLKKMMNL